MKPNQHEYKTMQLYFILNKIYPLLDEVLKIKNLNVTFNKKPKDLYFHFKRLFMELDLMA